MKTNTLLKNKKNLGAPKKEHKAKIRSMRFTDEEWQVLTKLGRAKWIREQINKLTQPIDT